MGEDSGATPVKKVWVAYICLFIGGGFGLHLWYLGRPLQCALWSLTGSVGGVGWLYDLFAIPRYTEEANFLYGCSSSSFKMIQDTRMSHGRPSVGIIRFLALCLFGAMFCLPAKYVLPEEAPEVLKKLALATGQAFGLWCVANSPVLETVEFSKILFFCVLGSVYGAMSDSLFAEDSPVGQWFEFLATLCPIAATIYFTVWRKEMKPPSLLKGILWVCFVLGTFGACSLSGLYHYGEITTEDGERLRFKDMFDSALHPDLWKDIRHCFMNGNCFQDFAEHVAEGFELDGGRGKAYKTLGLENGAPLEEIKARHRALVLQNHPDKCTKCSDEEKKERSDKFMEIQNAYKILQKEPEMEF